MGDIKKSERRSTSPIYCLKLICYRHYIISLYKENCVQEHKQDVYNLIIVFSCLITPPWRASHFPTHTIQMFTLSVLMKVGICVLMVCLFSLKSLLLNSPQVALTLPTKMHFAKHHPPPPGGTPWHIDIFNSDRKIRSRKTQFYYMYLIQNHNH